MTSTSWSWDGALTGVVPPLISPLTESGDVDGEATGALAEHVLGGGCSGLFVLGGCGEGAWLTTAQRDGVVRAAATAAAGRVPVLAGVMLPATGPAAEAARSARDEGADAVVVGSPYYFGVDGEAHRRHVEAVIEAAAFPRCSTISRSAPITRSPRTRCARWRATDACWASRTPRVTSWPSSASSP